MTENELLLIATQVIKKIKKNNFTLSVAESCTGGWLSKILTDVSGVSAVYKGGVCSYSNEVKVNLLGVSEEALATEGAVSSIVATQMATGVRKALNTDIGVGITGIAGPNSDNTSKPIGLIFIAVADENGVKVTQLNNTFTENVRNNNRLSALNTALNILSSTGDYK